ncbi:beta family protein [Xanthomonas campestris]|uniref:Beta family protein n=1 Tax=Xanthomonas campestris pv. papavericola TaxID=487881 RepID=A0AAJ3CDV9_XANCA|nr:beta family protein [Xanthomonas campestris]MEC3888092.1 beta family protein [Xanthomonas campestris pv. papavericola]
MATFPTYPQYVPIIKWQKYEQRALLELTAAVAPRALPCVEVRDSKQHESMLACFSKVWKYPALVDYANPEGMLTKTRLKELNQFLKLVDGSGKLATPVLNPTTAAHDFAAISTNLGDRRIALRLRVDLPAMAMGVLTVKNALAAPGLPDRCDRLLVDLGRTPVTQPADLAALAAALQTFKDLGFAHLHLSSGCFPASLSHINGIGEVERRDWKLWHHVQALAPLALVGYSDYGPLNPDWTEEILQRRGSRVTIRYALDDKWRIVRGSRATKQESVAISYLFVTMYPHEYQGAAFSFGDKLIADRVDPTIPLNKKSSGHLHITEYWTHHISYVLTKQY